MIPATSNLKLEQKKINNKNTLNKAKRNKDKIK